MRRAVVLERDRGIVHTVQFAALAIAVVFAVILLLAPIPRHRWTKWVW